MLLSRALGKKSTALGWSAPSFPAKLLSHPVHKGSLNTAQPVETCCFLHQNKVKPPFTSCNVQVYLQAAVTWIPELTFAILKCCVCLVPIKIEDEHGPCARMTCTNREVKTSCFLLPCLPFAYLCVLFFDLVGLKGNLSLRCFFPPAAETQIAD